MLVYHRIFVLGLLIFFLDFLGCEFPSDPQLRRVAIVVGSEFLGDAAFSPNPVRVPLAGKIVWKNMDNISHSIVGDAESGPCAFRSEPIGPGKRFKKVFHQRVVCRYYCGLHGRTMRGKFIVE
ncbi:MAG: plastocyanin/azurin family copper-binding protein [Nitrospiria bacterium]